MNNVISNEATVREAIAEIVTPVYSRAGFSKDTERQIIDYLIDPEQAKREFEDDGMEEPTICALKVRTALWSYSGGTVSARITSELFTKLGRESELGYLPVEGGLVKHQD